MTHVAAVALVQRNVSVVVVRGAAVSRAPTTTRGRQQTVKSRGDAITARGTIGRRRRTAWRRTTGSSDQGQRWRQSHPRRWSAGCRIRFPICIE